MFSIAVLFGLIACYAAHRAEQEKYALEKLRSEERIQIAEAAAKSYAEALAPNPTK